MLLGGRTNISLGESFILKHNILRWKVSLVSLWINAEASEELQDMAQVTAYVLLFAELEAGKANHSVCGCRGCSHAYPRSLGHHRLPMGTETLLVGDSE